MTTAVRERALTWEWACSDIAREILDECGVDAPPVNAWTVARALGLRVAFDTFRPGRRRLERIGGRTAILVRPDDRPEREQWTLAHEIGQAVAARVFAQLGIDPLEVPPQRREQVANAMASSLLLPEEWFLRDARLLDADVLHLKSVYSTASHELILMNLLKLPQLSLASVFDQSQLTRRRGNGQLSPPPLLPLERRIWRIVQQSCRPAEGTADGVRVQGWPVCQHGRRRELLRTTAVEGLEGMAMEHDDGCEAELMCAD